MKVFANTATMQQPNVNRAFGLSKSLVSAYEQCPKRLWLMTHRPELGATSLIRHNLRPAMWSARLPVLFAPEA